MLLMTRYSREKNNAMLVFIEQYVQLSFYIADDNLSMPGSILSDGDEM